MTKNNVPDWENKTVIITGGSSGIGRSAALQFASMEAKVLITGRKEKSLQKVAGEHQNIEYFVADAGKPEDATATVEKAVELWDRVDILINNAGAGQPMPVHDLTMDKMSNIFTVNVYTPSLMVKAALPYLKAVEGAIINISSTFGHKAASGLSHYAASKAALEHLTKCWALEFADQHIRVNAIAPGPTDTNALEGIMGLSRQDAEKVKHAEKDQIPLNRRGNPDEVARWILILADPSSSSWVTGQVIPVDGGYNLS